jgi:hypothetical protein
MSFKTFVRWSLNLRGINASEDKGFYTFNNYVALFLIRSIRTSDQHRLSDKSIYATPRSYVHARGLLSGTSERGAQRKPKKTLRNRPKSLPRNLARQSGQPSPYQATLRGRTGYQVPIEQPCEVKRMTKTLSSNLTRRSERQSPCRATLRGGAGVQVPA